MQDVMIHFQSRMIYKEDQSVEEQKATFQGQAAIKNGSLFLRYQEVMEELGEVSHTIKIMGDQATILRQGPITMRQPLEQGARTEGTYRSPYGRMATTTKTNVLRSSWNPEIPSGSIYIEYELAMQGQEVGLCQLTYNLTGGLS
ncbi:uncharacterized beta-barrel protein YwiB (DUF1934 family) [Scopulibacillus darangshiensis]|uniref:Uncharacterized beta-barrel protein YwiB (DUF1934 family) n=1 Tax=Scopulibacillus darangshiensis TaxID=442528 RepID=A0A4R2NN11_9BACL|nr:DUF1934 domain-containing protein [Scopulibacillus darangshiensis]TCP23020.1 uncharacterized beta-barrel protein YwiB (DUF1934 family) [Scopulibacillus darangshiensis]